MNEPRIPGQGWLALLGGGEFSFGQTVDADFAWVTAQIMDVAARHASGRVVSTLEGGYALPALGRSAVAHVRALTGL